MSVTHRTRRASDELDIIVLAGDRGPGDPLAVEAGVAGKTLVPIGGRAMLARVLDVLCALEGVRAIHVVAPDSEAHRTLIEGRGDARLHRVAPANSPSRSVARALADIPAEQPVLLTTGDHPLLTPQMIDEVRARTRPETDFAVALAPWPAVSRRFPGSRRTRYHCRDQAWCGTNLFLIASARGRRLAEIWQQVEQDRKSPWRVARLLGPLNLLLFVMRRLTLDDALERLSRRIGVRLQAVPLSDPEGAVDVDTPADKSLVETVLASREGAHVAH